MNKHRLFLWPIALLLGLGMAFSCAPPDDDDGPSKPSKPDISRVMYDFHTGELTLNGSNLPTTDLKLDKIYVGLKGTEIALKDSSGAKAEQVSITTSKHIYKITDDAVHDIFEKDGKLNKAGTAYNLKLDANWVMADTGSQQDTIEISVIHVTDEPGLTKVLMEKSGSNYDLTLEGYNLGTAELQLGKISVSVGEDQSSALYNKVSRIRYEDRMHSYRITDPTIKGYFDKDGPMAKDGDQYELKLAANWATTTTGGVIESIQIEVSGFSTKVNEASYDVSTNILTLEGTNLTSATATQEQIRTIRVDGVVLTSYTADNTPSGSNSDSLAAGSYRIKDDGTKIWIKLTSGNAATLEDKPGMDSDGSKAGKLDVSTGTWAGLDTAKDLMVTGNSPPSSPAITSAGYNVGTGVLVITGTNLPSTVGGWDFTKLKFVAGNGTKSTALKGHAAKSAHTATGSEASTTSLTITLTGTEKTKADGILVKNGLRDDGGKYNLEALAGFAGGSAEDPTGNDIYVVGNPAKVNEARYNVSTNILTLKGINLHSATQEQIRTIRVDGVALTSYTPDDTATGADSDGIAAGRYRFKFNDNTEIWIKLTSGDATMLEDKPGMDSDGSKAGKLTSTGAWAGLDTAKDLIVSGNAGASSPAITSASYDIMTDILTLLGTNLTSATATRDQIRTVRVDEVALDSYAPDDTATGTNSNSLLRDHYRIKNDGTKIWVKLTSADATELEDKPGMDSDGNKAGKLDVSTGSWAGLNIAKGLTVSGNTPPSSPTPAITSATYDVVTGALVITGNNLPSAVNGWDFSKLKLGLSGSETALSVHAPSGMHTATGSNPGATTLTIILTGTEKAKADVLDTNGIHGSTGVLYNLKAEAGFATASLRVEDTTNSITVSGHPAKVTSASYDVRTDILTLEGTNLHSATEEQIQTIEVDGVALNSYTPDNSATGPDSGGLALDKYRIKTDGTKIWIKLTNSDATALENKPGMASNSIKAGKLSVGAGTWAGLDTAKALTVIGNKPPPTITSANYNAHTGVLVITGTDLPTTENGWDFTKLKFVAGNGITRSAALSGHAIKAANTATGSSASAIGLTITLTGTEKTKADDILVKNGPRDGDGLYNLEASAGFVTGSLDVEDLTGNAIVVTGNPAISVVAYTADTGKLLITGTNLPTTVGGWDFTKLKVGASGSEIALSGHAAASTDTATGSEASLTTLTITLKGAEKTKVDNVLNKNGNSDAGNIPYNFKAEAGFATASLRVEDPITPIYVTKQAGGPAGNVGVIGNTP